MATPKPLDLFYDSVKLANNTITIKTYDLIEVKIDPLGYPTYDVLERYLERPDMDDLKEYLRSHGLDYDWYCLNDVRFDNDYKSKFERTENINILHNRILQDVLDEASLERVLDAVSCDHVSGSFLNTDSRFSLLLGEVHLKANY